MDLRQSNEYANYMRQTGWQVLVLKNMGYVYKRSLGFLGSILKVQRFGCPFGLDELETLARKHRAVFVKLEPAIRSEKLEKRLRDDLYDYGFREDFWPLVPPSTRVLDLSLSEKVLFRQFSENARRNIRKAEKSNLSVVWDDDGWFYENWKKAAKEIRFYVPSDNNFKSMRRAFGEKMKIANVINERGDWLAGVVVLLAGRRAYYYYASANNEGKKMRAPYMAAWEGIKWVKNNKCRLWDWEGVADERFKDTNTKAWRGFGDFKSKFGGEKVIYVGSFIKYYGLGKGLGLIEKIFSW